MCYKYTLAFLNKTYIYKLKHRKTKTRNKAFFILQSLEQLKKAIKTFLSKISGNIHQIDINRRYVKWIIIFFLNKKTKTNNPRPGTY